ncbi:MMS19 nucleotide excision repair protein homolog [Morus notabilis]|uniref:MMS19 nucleotide excision repair protein homolog n=1 Tax=Morus notabilis TaxID=981085 RepID=UPI000CECFA04|nr:MMS19 nucleotide excision repair protein homolog [Morus notabilis]
MAEPSVLTRHIESYVDTTRSLNEQAASLDSIISLVKNGLVTIEKLVREMDMYLTTTDHVIRARGILLLAELLTNLSLKPLDNVTIHSLIDFFADRLVDWRTLRGALVGCLALLRRKSDAGMVPATDAKAVALSYVKNLQVQSLGQHDRKLCFELLECLLVTYPNEVASLGEDIIYSVCESVDGEKDPHCLMLVFHIIPALVGLFPNPSGSLASFPRDLFEVLGCYFPIHFTHHKVEDVDVKRDDLSRALMIAFSSTPLLEPFVIPLLLEKLSSSLSSAKIDSLKYLSYCSIKYGADRMARHAGILWSSIKNAISTSLKEPTESFYSESIDGLGFQENEVVSEALVLLETVVMQNNNLLLSMIVDDEDISTVFNTMTSYGRYKDIPLQGKQRLHVVGRILYITTKTSIASCNRVLETFFRPLVDILQLSIRSSSRDWFLNFGALYLCMELLAACRDLVIYSRELASNSIPAHETFCCILQSFCVSLIDALCSILETTANEGADDVDIYLRVRSLQILATFPEDLLAISDNVFKNILTTLMSIIFKDFNQKFLWKLALKALVHIGSFVSRYESEKAQSYNSIVVEKMVSWVSVDNCTLPFPLKLEAVSEIGASGRNHMLNIVQGLEGAIFSYVSDFYVHGNVSSAEVAIQLLQFYSEKVIPWIHETEGLEEILLRFATNIWDHVESWISCNVEVQEKGLLDAIMMAMKLTVGSCSEEIQYIILQKAYTVLSSNTSLLLKKSSLTSIPVQLEESQLIQHVDNISHRDELVLSLFASVIIAVRPRTEIPNMKEILYLFLTTLLRGHVPSAQALGSMINKFDTKAKSTEISRESTLEDAMDIIFKTKSWFFRDNEVLQRNGNGMGLKDLCLGLMNNIQLQVHAIVGLAWIGKGLLLRGHEKVKDVIMTLLECLMPDSSTRAAKLKQDSFENILEQDFHPSVRRSAADAFHILMSDSGVCLNKIFHAIIRPLYKQHLFSVVMPLLQSLLKNFDPSFSRSMLYRASVHIIADAPLIVVVSEAKKLISLLLEGLSILSEDILDKDQLYSLLLVLSAILTDKKGEEAVIENAHSVINCLIGLIAYPHMMLVRETTIQCLVAMSKLPHTRIYPMRTKVLQAMSKALDDPKRAVRQEAVRCQQAWASIA